MKDRNSTLAWYKLTLMHLRDLYNIFLLIAVEYKKVMLLFRGMSKSSTVHKYWLLEIIIWYYSSIL